MEWKSNLNRSQSLKAMTCDKPIWCDTGLRDKKTSVSQLVARYQETRQQIQTTTRINAEVKQKEEIQQVNKPIPHVTSDSKNDAESFKEPVIWKDDVWRQPKTSLTRSKSLGSLQSSPISIHALKNKFESKAASQREEPSVLSTPRKPDIIMHLSNKEENKDAAEGQKTWVDAPGYDKSSKAKQVSAKVENQSRIQRKTVGGVDFEMVAATLAEEKRRSIADFRDSSEKVCVSVKAISALYLSKAAPQEPNKTLVQSSEVRKRTKLTKMAEDLPQPPALEGDHSEYQVYKSAMQQRRQKNELKRLLKHTHPEFNLDKVLDKELLAVLNSETEMAAAEKEYEGEVFSKCLIFENSATSKMEPSYSMHMAEEIDKNAPTGREEAGNHSDHIREVTEEEIRVDVQTTRRIFEEQSLKALKNNPHKKTWGIPNGDEALSSQIKKFEMQEESKPEISDSGSIEQGQCDNDDISEEDLTSILEPEETCFEDPVRSMDLFQHNPFISSNIEKEHSFLHTTKIPEGCSAVVNDCIPANVKDRKHLFESMPFDKIRQQNKDDIETMVENIRETLQCLYSSNLIQSHGSIIEVHETMIAIKSRFSLTEMGPEIMLDTVVEGGVQNLILQLLPRANIRPHIKYLKENSDSAIRATMVSVPMHENNLDTEFKTANIVQLIEDIIIQDNSLRKGVLIQEEVDRCAEVSVYSLFHYVDGEDIKSYCPPQQTSAEEAEKSETKTSEVIQTELAGLNSGFIESAIHCLQETAHSQMCTSPVRPEITSKGNVKLFKSCIEKGDLEYLRSLQAETEMEDEVIHTSSKIPEQQTVEEATQYEPVDIKKLKGIFSADQTKQDTCKNYSQGTHVCKPQHKTTSKHQLACSFIDPVKAVPFEDDGCIHQAELVAVVDEVEEISNLQTAISDLQKATVEAKSIHDSLQERQDKHQLSLTTVENSSASITPTNHGMPLKTNEDLCYHHEQKSDFRCQEKKELSQEAEISYDLMVETESEEVVFEGKLKAALQSLERSNINVTRGDFKAAMIYRNHSKPNTHITLADKSSSIEQNIKESVSKDPLMHDILRESASPSEAVLERTRKPPGPKPALPPKPEHLKVKQKEDEINKLCQTRTATSEMQSQKKDEICSHLEPKTATMTSWNTGESASKVTECLVKPTKGLVEIPVSSQNSNTDRNIIEMQKENIATAEPKTNKEETDESHVNFHEARQKFSGQKPAIKKTAPVKPKRVKIAEVDTKSQKLQPNTAQVSGGEQTVASCTKSKNCEGKPEQKVEMREKKVRKETEDQRRQRLSVHMDEIMRGNITTAMEIFDNLRKQEELENILIRVDEIEQDTSEVDVKSLRKVFEAVPGWVVSTDKTTEKIEQKDQQRPQLVKQNSETKSSMAHVFGDLERASAEIINLKEQTLARLLDIEEAIKKALFSVSNLKSESDIAGLSSLFKESLGRVQTPTSSGNNISTIRIGSSRIKTEGSALKTNENQDASGDVVAKQQGSPTSSPAFISIQSAARKTEAHPEMTLYLSCQHSSKAEEKFRTTKTVQCNSPASIRKVDPQRGGRKQCPVKPKREVQTDPKKTNALDTKTITENYERTDNFGNKFYSTKKSTILTTEPQTVTSPIKTVVSPASHQVYAYPEVKLPINKKP